MDQKQAKKLLEKFRLGKLSEEEKALLESWYLDWQVDESLGLSETEIVNELQQLRSAIPYLGKKSNTVRLWPRIAAAASILLFFSAAGYFIVRKQPGQQIAQIHLHDIAPGNNKATLTLGNGQKIILNNKLAGQIAMQGSMAITKTANGQLQYRTVAKNNSVAMLNTVTTNCKEQYKVVLSDGTNVWLNAASSISYPTFFSGKNRDVSITGEAYFEVAHNVKKPFRVAIKGETVEVLGTHFNINAYTDEPSVKTTLLEGSVKVSVNNRSEIIKPGQQATYKEGLLHINDADLEKTVAWKNGYFRFNQEKIEPIMRQLSRWYDIDIRYNGQVSEDEFTASISKFRNLSEVLKALEYYKTVHFKIEGRRVTVLK